jgi:pimeloyl-ACP methyl ester carboxylesterase
MTAPLLLLVAAVSVAGPGGRPQILRIGGDLAPGVLVNRSAGARPFDPPDPSRATVVFVHGFNPAPHAVHFTMAERLAEAVARRGGPPLNVLAWDWNGATYVGLDPRVNAENTIGQGQRLAAAVRVHGLAPGRVHLIGHSAGGIVAASAARVLLAEVGQPVAQLTLLEPAAFYHHVIFERLAAGSSARRVENYWAPGPSGYGREVGHAGVRNVRVDHPTPWLGTVHPLRSGHLHVVRWYLGTVEDRASPAGFNASVSCAPGW